MKMTERKKRIWKSDFTKHLETKNKLFETQLKHNSRSYRWMDR